MVFAKIPLIKVNMNCGAKRKVKVTFLHLFMKCYQNCKTEIEN